MREYEQFGRRVEQARKDEMSMYSQDELDSIYGDLYDDLCGLEEHNAFTYSTDTEWDNAEAMELGKQQPERAWIVTDRDVIHPNPYYLGPPVPHPECPDFYHPPVETEEFEGMDPADLNDCHDFDDDIPF